MNSTVNNPEVLFEEHPDYFMIKEGEDGAEAPIETPEGFNIKTDIRMNSVYQGDWTILIDGVWIPYDKNKHEHLWKP